MIVYAVQWHAAPLPPHADVNDLDWTTWPGHDDYADEREADEAAREFDAGFDGAYVHRVVARRVNGPSVARTEAAVGSSRQSSADQRKVGSARSSGSAPTATAAPKAGKRSTPS